jgi:hypothetical protein
MLIAWEQGRDRHPVDRALLLRALTAPAADPGALADEPLGRCNAALLEARAATFGGRLRAAVDCPECGAALEFDLDTIELLESRPPAVESVEVDGMRFRPPCHRDLARIAREADAGTAAHRLTAMCALTEPGGPEEGAHLTALIDEIEQALETADPWANLSLELQCEECRHRWAEALDVPALLWDEVQHRARMLLDEVHLLAREYGWTEDVILALSDQRRAAYLQRVMT